MKRLILVLATIALYAVRPASYGSDKVILGINEWCPYICSEPTEKRGIFTEIVKEIFEREGYDVDFRMVPFVRGIAETRSGSFDGIIGIVIDVAPNLVYPSEALFSTQFCIYSLVDSTWEFKGFDSSYPELKIGIISGKEAISFDFDKAFPSTFTVHGNQDTVPRLIRLLMQRRIDVFIEAQTTVDYELSRDSALSKLRVAGCVKGRDEYVAFSPENPRAKEYADLITRGLIRLKMSGRIDRIVRSYTK